MTAIEAPPVTIAESSDIRAELQRLHGKSWGWALACCDRDRELAQDVLQTAYVRILSGDASFNGQSSFKTWVFGVIRMIARSERRRGHLWTRRHARIEEVDALASGTADARVESRDEVTRLVRALARLSARQQEVLHLVFYHELTVD